jgi:hypothetical protein
MTCFPTIPVNTSFPWTMHGTESTRPYKASSSCRQPSVSRQANYGTAQHK